MLMSKRLFVFVECGVPDQHSYVNDDDEEEEEEEQDHNVDSDVERPVRAHRAQRPRRSVLG